MKKITYLSIVLAGLAFASCKKDKTCTCTNTDSQGNVTTETYTLTKISGKDAKDACNKTTWSYTSGSTTNTGSSDCKLS